MDENRFWLEDFALFAALKRQHGLRPWVEWDGALRRRESSALANAAATLAEQVNAERFRQWLFNRQWTALKNYAKGKGIRLLATCRFSRPDSATSGDQENIFSTRPASDSRGRRPTRYFSPTGQRGATPSTHGVMQRRRYAGGYRHTRPAEPGRLHSA